jgi:hypothetical protein
VCATQRTTWRHIPEDDTLLFILFVTFVTRTVYMYENTGEPLLTNFQEMNNLYL